MLSVIWQILLPRAFFASIAYLQASFACKHHIEECSFRFATIPRPTAFFTDLALF